MALKALVVDDEKLIVKGLRFSLMQDNYEVDCAYDGEEALEMARNGQYDIILLDVMLPRLTGLEVLQQIREFSQVPVIMRPGSKPSSGGLLSGRNSPRTSLSSAAGT